ncbi:hypothetical protein [Chitinivorax sp. B]|uniref:hypothetical protein n=1 Tax=Chitinivorax sp. B TaxID=2502235 RepID=UPI0010F73313|nr:hypothetical protein [Chitinivorax sp. B]
MSRFGLPARCEAHATPPYWASCCINVAMRLSAPAIEMPRPMTALRAWLTAKPCMSPDREYRESGMEDVVATPGRTGHFTAQAWLRANRMLRCVAMVLA